jgi:hypothetical protein
VSFPVFIHIGFRKTGPLLPEQSGGTDASTTGNGRIYTEIAVHILRKLGILLPSASAGEQQHHQRKPDPSIVHIVSLTINYKKPNVIPTFFPYTFYFP